ncbi:MAG: glycosyltransferase family 2 protein, partial [Candidatus Omnitrophica bacterium]|nr:glycosyltransferase family 2 protein [Candidatus Omnitrophota bacterium]
MPNKSPSTDTEEKPPVQTDPSIIRSACPADETIDDLLSKDAILTPDQIKQEQLPSKWEKWVKGAIIGITGAIIMAAVFTGFFGSLAKDIPKEPLGKPWLWGMAFYGAVYYCAMGWRIWLWLKYRPAAAVDDEDLPSVSVIIPAFNEGRFVKNAIHSAAHSNYPGKKLQVIVVDDGSTDDTWYFIKKTASRSPIRVETIRQPVNKGKKHAMYAGFKRATGKILVTIDSDSIVARDAIRNGVAPFVRDKSVGVVAGCVKVLNRNESVITRLLKVEFSLSFSFARSYQSEIRGLLTVPGALAFYRASAVRPVLKKWLNQTFLKAPCLIGEDRSMTNLIYAQGFNSSFQSNAVVWTKVPPKYRGMTKMFLRWARSNVRETVILMSFIFTPFRRSHLCGFRINSLLVTLSLVAPY